MSATGETFSFNGKSCEDYQLMIYDIGGDDSGDSTFASVVSITEETVASRWKPYFYGTQFQEKLSFSFTFGVNQCRIDDGEYLTKAEIDDIATWLTGHDKYMWLEIDSDDMENIRYHCMITELKLVEFGHIPWAFEATVTCDSPFAYRTPGSQSFAINGTRQIVFNNLSSLNGYYYPEIHFDISSGGGFSIENMTDGGRTLTFADLPGSVHRVNVFNDSCVVTNDQDLNIYDKCNYNWLRFKRGENTLNVVGNGTLTINYEFPVNIGGI